MAEDWRQDRVGDVVGRTDAQHAAQAVFTQGAQGLVIHREHLPGVAQQLQPGFSESLLPPVLLEQIHPDLLLQALHVLGHR
ncbi:hypothetical protein D9M71_790740 [compost metagenome]